MNSSPPSTNLPSDRNALSSIHCLPAELLLSIFRLVMETWRDYGDDDTSDQSYYAALRRLRLVASGWSLIINTTPRFWIYISPFVPEVQRRVALERSQNMLLDVNCMPSRRPQSLRLPESFVYQLSRVSQRIGHLNVRETDLEDLVNKGVSMTGLASLLVRNQGFGGSQDAPWTKVLVSSAPNIRKLTLTDCSFDWPDPGWTNLESLRIQIGPWARAFNLATILKTLSASPGLKNLELTGRETPTVLAGPQLSVVHLPKLETLSIQLDSTIHTFQFFDSIDASPTVNFWLTLNQENLSATRLRTLGRFADRMDFKGGSLTVLRSNLDVGSFGIRIYNRGDIAEETLMEGLRNFFEGFGKS